MSAPASFALPGGFTAPDSGPFVTGLHRLMEHHNIAVGARKVNRLAQGFLSRTARWDVDAERRESLFGDWLEHSLDLTTEQRHRITSDPDFSRVVSYADPVGEEAVNNVLHAKSSK